MKKKNSSRSNKPLPSQPPLVQNKTLILNIESFLKPLPKEHQNKGHKGPVILSIMLGIGALFFFMTNIQTTPSIDTSLANNEEMITKDKKVRRKPASIHKNHPTSEPTRSPQFIEYSTPDYREDSSFTAQSYTHEDNSYNDQSYNQYDTYIDESHSTEAYDNYSEY